ncbi:MAG: serine acetyltransferase [Ruminococcus flavefaciens]|nr:serine acetyltransferase [Ruminococcus flavefaciens]MCM1230885.1 serine acetyltransferase [Ruminococcus flavefaciens]
MGRINQDRVDGIVRNILQDYGDGKYINHTDLYNQPDKKAVIDIIEKLFKIIYPGFYSDKVCKVYSLRNSMSAVIEDVIFHLNKQIAVVLRYCFSFNEMSDSELEEKAENMTFDFMERLPQIREYLETDVQSAYDGDPAVSYKAEIILSYPGLYAISVYRIAHELSLLGVPMIPRIMSEYAHSVTGIDIHPGAVIGKYFFIDHGTGVVIGETTVIGEHVKIYQGVTLGGLSTKGGQNLRGIKRHPTIKDNVTIYSNSSILGGDTVIGENVVIGGNTFITESVAENTRVTLKAQELQFR